jgi:hypothetical protein
MEPIARHFIGDAQKHWLTMPSSQLLPPRTEIFASMFAVDRSRSAVVSCGQTVRRVTVRWIGAIVATIGLQCGGRAGHAERRCLR